MDNTLILTLLPNGFAADDRLRLSVVAGFQLDPLLAKFEASPITVWPRLSNELVVGALQAGTDEPIAVTRVPAEPASSTLWDAIFDRDAPVGDPPATTAEADAYRNVRTPLAHGAAHRALTGLYDEARVTSPTAALRPDHPVALAVRALAELTGDAAPPARGQPAIPAAARELLDPDRLTPGRLDDAVRELSAAGRPDAARLAALAPAVRRQRAAAGAVAPPAGPRSTRRGHADPARRRPTGARADPRPPHAGSPAGADHRLPRRRAQRRHRRPRPDPRRCRRRRTRASDLRSGAAASEQDPPRPQQAAVRHGDPARCRHRGRRRHARPLTGRGQVRA